MIALTDDPAADLARRAMARPSWRRFDPIVCCDGQGRYVGVVTLERLITFITG